MTEAKLFSLNVASPLGELFSGEVEMVIVPGQEGELGILANHTPLLSALGAGRLRIKKRDEGFESYEINSGFIEVNKNKVTILTRLV